MNSRRKFDATPLRCGFGVKEDAQIEALHEMKNLINSMRFSNNVARETKLPFQKGILLGIQSMIGLYEDMKKKGVECILTARLNQDCVENCFSRMRALGNSHPGPADIMMKMKMLLIGSNVGNIIQTCAVEIEDNEPAEQDNFVSMRIVSKVKEFEKNNLTFDLF